MDSTFVSAYSALGALYNRMNRPTESIITLRSSLRINPTSQHNFRIYKNLAEAHLILNEFENALDCLEKSKSLNPNYPETEKCYAMLFESMGDNHNSILHWRRYLALETDSITLLVAQAHLDSLRQLYP